MKPREFNSPAQPEPRPAGEAAPEHETSLALELRWMTHGGLQGKPFTIHLPKPPVMPTSLPAVKWLTPAKRIWQNFPRFPGRSEDVVTLEFFWFYETE
jgi:hypothetical protein